MTVLSTTLLINPSLKYTGKIFSNCNYFIKLTTLLKIQENTSKMPKNNEMGGIRTFKRLRMFPLKNRLK